MIGFSGIKINLGLNIVSRREDGFHNLESVFLPLPIGDVIEIFENSKRSKETQLKQSGLGISIPKEENIVYKAWELLHLSHGISFVSIHLHKIIPAGAGLGGGSSDGVTVLKMLDELFELKLSQEQLADYALKLGSDCPFFTYDHPAFVEGRGEVFSDVKIKLDDYQFLIVHPGLHSSTSEAFKGVKIQTPLKSIKEIIECETPQAWRFSLKNDFEETIFKIYPEINLLKQAMYNNGCEYASMSGSGSAVYGIFRKRVKINFPKHYFVRWCTISEPF